MTLLQRALHGTGLGARLMRSSTWIILGFGASQVIRFGSNLILTRLLFPEDFGMMTLVTVFMVGLAMFSDIGIGPSIQQNARGDDPDFLNTAWTIQVIRGLCLWLICCVLAWPVALFYGEPQLLWFLPVAGLSLLVSGFTPTRVETANRKLQIGRVMVLDLISQLLSVLAMLLLAWAFRSVWSLVIGGLIAAVVRLLVMHVHLPGQVNRIRWETSAVHDLIAFGRWIFLSTLCGFLLAQGDKAILGKCLPLDMLGIYNIGYFLASFPLTLAGAVTGRILIPLYRERPPGASESNFRKVRRMRFWLSVGIFSMQFLLAFFGVGLISLLYDTRYGAAGPVVVAVACMHIPYLVGMTYDHAALAAGDSKNTFYLLAIKAAAQTSFFLIGIQVAGLPGALVGQALSMALVHPMVVRLAQKHGAWDPLHDLAWGVLGLGLGGLALWLNSDALALLEGFAVRDG